MNASNHLIRKGTEIAVHRVTAFVTFTALLFCLFFQVNKGGPFRDVNPFGQDPYDAVGSFAIQVAFLVGALTYARALRLREAPAQAAKTRLILRGNVLVLIAILVTLGADGIAEVVRPYPPSYWGQVLLVELGLMALLAVVCVIALAAVFARRQMVAPPGDLTPADGIDDLWTLVCVPVTKAGAVLPHALVAWVRRVQSDWLFARLPWLNPRTHPWRFACALGLLIGLGLAVVQLQEGLPPSLEIGLLVAGIFLSAELGATLLGFALLGGYLGLRPSFHNSDPPGGRRQPAPLRPITPAGIRARLGRGGRVNWIDRQARTLGDADGLCLPHDRLIITGPVKVGKTREAAELIRCAVDQGLVPLNRIYEPAPDFRLLVSRTLRAAVGRCLPPPQPALLFLDDLPSRFYGEGLKQLDEALAALHDCQAGYVVATARTDQLATEHWAWLEGHHFQVVELPGLDEEQTGRLVDCATGTFELQIDDAARAELVAGRDGTPELPLAALRLLRAEGVTQVDQAMARRAAHRTLAEAWAEVRRTVEARVPAAEPLLGSLSTFHAAGVEAYTPLLLPLAARLWRRSVPSPRPRSARAALRSAVGALARFDLVECGPWLTYPDVAVEGLIAPAPARARLERFLLRRRRALHNPLLRGLYRHAAPHGAALFELASAAQQRGEHGLAVRLYTAALRVRRHPGLYYHRGVARQAQGDLAGAIADYDRAVAHDPQNASAYYKRGSVRQAQGDLARAIADYDRALAHDPDHAAASYNRGLIRQAGGDLAAAIADYDHALALDPRQAAAYYNRGLAHQAQGEMAAAIADYDRAIELDLQLAQAYDNRGVARAELGDLAEAIADYGRAIVLDPHYSLAYNNRGNARADQGDLAGAIADYDRALELDPHYAAAYGNRGVARADQGDLAQAIADYDHALEFDPHDAAAYYNRGVARQARGDLAAAIADLDRAIELDPHDAVAYNSRANTRQARGDLAGAIADYDRALELDPQNVAAHNNRGLARQARGDLAGAIADYDRALEFNAENAAACYNRGTARTEQGDLAGAIADYDRALDLDPGTVNAYYGRGRAYRQQGQVKQAQADLHRFLELCTDARWRAQAEELLKEL